MIRGTRVQLRPVEETDYPLIHRWMNHPEVWRYMDYERPYSMADVREDVEEAQRSGHPYVIQVGDRPIGRIGLNQFRTRDRICSLYLYVGEPEFWGQGYAAESVMTLLGFAFDRLDLHLVELWTLADNNRAILMYGKCGFVQEGRLRERSWKDGRWVDHLWMSVNREEFEQARAAWAARS